MLEDAAAIIHHVYMSGTGFACRGSPEAGIYYLIKLAIVCYLAVKLSNTLKKVPMVGLLITATVLMYRVFLASDGNNWAACQPSFVNPPERLYAPMDCAIQMPGRCAARA